MSRQGGRRAIWLVCLVWFSWAIFWMWLGGQKEWEVVKNKVVSPPPTPRVVFVVVQTKPSHGWCQMMASAMLSNVTVVSVGYRQAYQHVIRAQWVWQYLESEGLHDDDVVVSFDGADTVFIGALPIQRAVRHFIDTSAPSFGAFDPEAVRRGEATPPLLFAAEGNCYHLQMTNSHNWEASKGKCVSVYKRFEQVMESDGKRVAAGRKKNRMHFLNAGGYVTRVWALKRALAAYRALLRSGNFWCDQSIWGMLYLGQRLPRIHASSETRLPSGLMGLDSDNNFFFCFNGMEVGRDIQLASPLSISKLAARDKPPFPSFLKLWIVLVRRLPLYTLMAWERTERGL
ncbi:expression site-associated gene (ESAG-like) protein [Trypanosoma cruzi marinkellei]|uniref:Expression site-associated gene (ESAG-like) protein n=1 Tax=Trypanosoma cruzi marinkellei TaxID=85056 RepID=K2MWE2_TRYCR|nr:expression site-associated gene (ESAG-like) protein [Trypanosoma cruzi marinkellei]